MMKGKNHVMPIKHLISFDKLLRNYDAMADGKDPLVAARAKRILKAQAPFPELRDGFTDLDLLDKHKEVIKIILQDSFPEVLSENEIKTATLPYYDIVFNSSKRFQKILENAGPGFIPKISNKDKEEGIDYIMACTVVLSFYFGFNLDFSRPIFYDIPGINGVMRHYRIMYNADFLEIFPTDKSPEITQDDVDVLLDNPHDIKLWKKKIPPESFITKGFIISNMFDVTTEHAISEIKSSLIASNKRGSDNFMVELQETFRSFFRHKDLRVGFVTYNSKENQFERVYGKGMASFLLRDENLEVCNEALCQDSYKKLIKERSYFTIADVEKYYKISKGRAPYRGLYEQGIKSAIFAPIVSEGKLLGVLEVVSTKKNALNAVNAQKLEDVMPYIEAAVQRSKIEEENLIDAVIQHECTTVHSSVLWKFKKEAKKFIIDDLEGREPAFNEIAFKDVYPLYGQIDIKDSSRARNTAIQRDLMIQLSEISGILEEAWQKNNLPIYEELIFRVNNHLNNIKETLHTNSEQAIFDFVMEEVTPVFQHLKKTDDHFKSLVADYEAKIDPGTESYYDHRRNYDESVMRINKELAAVIDKKQAEAQNMFPHYFERYKTDGVEHNMYIGNSIVGEDEFDRLFLSNLRLWQLQVMCEMENAHYQLKSELAVPLDVASLLLIYNTSLSIRFRMDEKRFDVDGTYNARYEVIKKRIDKSYIKGTTDRLTQTGKLAIVYSQKKDELEYLRYIAFLKSKGYFTNNIEILELEGLQGVSGLKAIRAEILYSKDKEPEKTYTYDDLMQELKA